MKKILFIFMLLGMVQSIMAQPAARRKQAQQKAQQSNADNMTLRAKLYFPTAIPMDEDVVWRRDIYRELNLTDDANAALYYPVEPTDGKMNLFTYIFKLMFICWHNTSRNNRRWIHHMIFMPVSCSIVTNSH